MISVILPTYNPNPDFLQQTLAGLQQQTLPVHTWELIIVDNNSINGFTKNINLQWHPAAKIITEDRQGLTYARLKGFHESKGELIVMVDDDNILSPGYLSQVFAIFSQHSAVGAIGGISNPAFEVEPPVWLKKFYGSLALRNLGDTVKIVNWDNKYPESAPIGAGMGIRKEALASYIKKIETGNSNITDRIGNALSSGGDNDIVLEILKSGWQVGYFPSLQLQHIIPGQRMQVNYLARLNNHSSKSWVQLLESHGISSWQKIPRWTVPLRKLKSFFTYKAWKGNVSYIQWRGACGVFDGIGSIK